MSNLAKNSFVFILGREQEIAYFELMSVLCRFVCPENEESFISDSIRISGNLVFANIDIDEVEVSRLINSLAGTIKIYKIIDKLGSDLDKTLINYINSKNPVSKVNFGISSFNDSYDITRLNRLGFSIKKKLKNKVSVRYLELTKDRELSSIISLKNKLTTSGVEFGIFQDSLGVLIALNNPEEWSNRDYDKPASDKYSGMVPPKLARMMVNLALGELVQSRKSKVKTENDNHSSLGLEIRNSDLEIAQHEVLVVDPFCGSGNILMEAMLLGCDVIGSDISEKAVSDTKKNVEWLEREYKITDNRSQITVTDATSSLLIENLKLKIENYDCFAIVCEPFLGEPKKFKSSFNAVSGEYLRIKELYIEFLKNIAHLFRDGEKQPCNVVCIVFPLVETMEGKRFSLFRESVDEIRKLGYTQIRNNFIYSRDYQIVKREIALLKLI